jgi:hypothetical protein
MTPRGVMTRNGPLNEVEVVGRVPKEGCDLGTQILEQQDGNPFVTQTLWILSKVTATTDHALKVLIGLPQIVSRTREPHDSAETAFIDIRFQTKDLKLPSTAAIQDLNCRGVNIPKVLEPLSTWWRLICGGVWPALGPKRFKTHGAK